MQLELNQLNTIKNQAYELYQAIKALEVEQVEKSDFERIKEAVAAKNFVVLDTETTGLGYTDEIIEIAIIDHNGKVLMDNRIEPSKPIPADAIAIHGITNEDVAGCPRFSDLLTLIKGHLAGKDVIVYNANYDRKLLHQSAEQAGLEKTNWKAFSNWSCAMLAFAPIFGEWNDYRGNYKWQRLSTAAGYYNIEVNAAHSALGDCLMTLAVINAMVDAKHTDFSIKNEGD